MLGLWLGRRVTWACAGVTRKAPKSLRESVLGTEHRYERAGEERGGHGVVHTEAGQPQACPEGAPSRHPDAQPALHLLRLQQ